MTALLEPGLAGRTETEAKVAAAERLIGQGRHEEGRALLTEALEADPSHLDSANALAASYLAAGDTARARAILAAGATARPDDARLVNNLGIAHQQAGDAAAALICFERAVALAPHLAGPRQSLAMARFLEGDTAGAETEARALLERIPDHADATGLLGTIALAQGELTAATELLRRALELAPDAPEHLRNLSICLLEAGAVGEALALARRARLAAPLSAPALEHLAACLLAAGEPAEAAATCRKLLAFAPNHLPARAILARALIADGKADTGIAELTAAVRADPKAPEPLLALALALDFAGRPEQALPFHDRALALAPEDVSALTGRQACLLALGRVAQEPAAMTGLVVVPPGLGAGEFILRARALVGADDLVLFAPEHVWPLATLIERARPLGLSASAPPAGATPLPALLRGAAAGDGAPYLCADATLAERWREALVEHPRPWIGLGWDEAEGGFGLSDLRAAWDGPGTAVSLVTGPARHGLAGWPEAVDAGVHIEGYPDLAALISVLDAVVGPDSAALHLAGALGHPGLVAVPLGHSWHWSAAADARSRWYPALSVLRQRRAGDWSAVSQAIAAWLARLAIAA